MMCLNLFMIAAINFSQLNIIQRLGLLLCQEKSECGSTQWCALRKTILLWWADFNFSTQEEAVSGSL